ncbi:MAG: ATP-binding cassette domain-containing protein, partial [Planctomycetota bacterium]
MSTPPAAPTTAPAVRVHGLQRRFGNFVAVNNVSFEVRPGEIFGFLGPNGAGKSTTIRMLCGILEPTGGEGVVAGFDIRRETERIKSRVGYMSQRFSLYDDLNVEENIDFFGGIYGLHGARLTERKAWALQMADLTDRRKVRTRTLPGGLKQRLALGCAVLHEPAIVFLDEPTSGVDPLNRRRFWDLIYRMAGSGTTVFVTTHYMDEAEYCDRVALIYRGQMIAMGSPAELKEHHMHEALLSVAMTAPQDALDLLAGVDGVREVALFGDGLHVALEPHTDTATMPQALDAALRAAGHGGTITIEPIAPSMEDRFVSLVEGGDRVH